MRVIGSRKWGGWVAHNAAGWVRTGCKDCLLVFARYRGPQLGGPPLRVITVTTLWAAQDRGEVYRRYPLAALR